MPRSALVLLLLVAGPACGRCGSGGSVDSPDAHESPRAHAPFAPTHLLVSDGPDGVDVRLGAGADWRLHRRLPVKARAVRVAPGGRHVAWVLDLVDAKGNGLSRGYAWLDGDEKPVSLGTLGLRKREAMGLTIADDGSVAYLDETGTLQLRPRTGPTEALGDAVEPLFGAGGRLAFAPRNGGCLVTRPTPLNACGGLLLPLAWDGPRLAYAAEHFVFIVDGKVATPYPELRDPTSAGLRGERLFVTRHADVEGITYDVIDVVDAPGAAPRRVHQAAVVVSASWDTDGALLVSTRPERRDLYELMLAHAPAEFSGESFAGLPVRIDAATGTSAPADDLPTRRVRQWRPLAATP